MYMMKVSDLKHVDSSNAGNTRKTLNILMLSDNFIAIKTIILTTLYR